MDAKTRDRMYEAFLAEYDIKDDLTGMFVLNPYKWSDAQKELNNTLCSNIVSYDTPGQYMKQCYGKVVRLLVGDPKEIDLLYAYFDKLNLLQYAKGYTRRSVRCKIYLDCAPWTREIVRTAFHLRMYGVSLADFLRNRLPEELLDYKQSTNSLYYLDDIIAAHLYAGDASVKQAIIEIINSDNNAALVTREIIRGILKSNDGELHALLGRLLLAARLQEGLRQTICENMDCGTVEAFTTLFDVIRDNDLLRFSSVKRAVATFIDMLDPEQLTRSSHKIFHLMNEAVHDQAACYNMTASTDPVAILVGLWGLGFREVLDAYREMDRIAKEGTGIQRQAAAYYNAMTAYPLKQRDYALTLVECGAFDIALAAGVFPEYMSSWHSEARNCAGIGRNAGERRPVDLSLWFGSPDRARKHLALLTELLASMHHKTYEFSPYLFPWHFTKITRTDVMIRIAAIANGLQDRDLMDLYASKLDEFEAGSGARQAAVKFLMSDPKSEAQRKALLLALGNKETYTRDAALMIAKQERFTEEEYAFLCELLRFKNADLRKGVLEVLKQQDEKGLKRSIDILLRDSREELRLGGLDLLSSLQEQGTDISSYRKEIEPAGEKEKLIYGRLFAAKQQTETLYTEEDEIKLPEIPYCKNDYPLFSCDSRRLEEAFRKLSELIQEHRYDEYTDFNGDKTALGASSRLAIPRHFGDQNHKVPFLPLWKAFYEQEIHDQELLLAMNISLSLEDDSRFMEKLYGKAVTAGCYRGMEHLEQNRYWHSQESVGGSILFALMELYCPQEYLHAVGKKVAAYVLHHTPADKIVLTSDKERYSHRTAYTTVLNDLGIYLPLRSFLSGWRNPEEFRDVFFYLHTLKEYFTYTPGKEKTVNTFFRTLLGIQEQEPVAPVDSWYNSVQASLLAFDAKGYLYAAYHGIITEPQMFWAFFEAGALRDHFRDLFPRYQQADRFGLDSDPALKAFVLKVTDQAVDRVVREESLRGDSVTRFSSSVTAIGRIHGIDHLITLLKAMDKESFARSGYLYYVSGGSRNDNLSHLISVSAPKESETFDMFFHAVNAAGIKEKRLVETAMYAPAWLDMIEQYLGYKGLKSAAYYFMAHMNDRYNRDEHKFAEIARYTPLEKEELFNGAFDRNWFFDAYETLGEKRFTMVYEAAKYAADGAKHTRARKYADASLGRMDLGSVEKEITEKRNKDLLMAYALIPYASREDLLHRYEFIQKFRKESLQFGSQRQASEKTACDMALRNLATLAGFSDVMRLTLAMESDLTKSLVSYFEVCDLDESAQAMICFDESGMPEVAFLKNGKKLSSIPAAYKKNTYVLELKDVQKKFTEQFRRTVKMLEQSMEDREVFSCGEIRELRENPILTGLIDNTVFVCNGVCGFITEEFASTEETALLRVAHPYDLYVSGRWKEIQRRFFRLQVKQAFKQVFRELYLKLEEELESGDTRMFAGHQIQPAKTLAMLKKRRWMADEESGLQKIFYKDDIVVELYALADWFSPADIEAPTLEFVSFRNRKTLEPILIKDVPDIVYSEAMRDTDLAVSVAHAGSVDPETSHSTIEMRKVIVERNIELFGLTNVRIEGTHAYINGKLGEYSVQLGSGVVMLVGSHLLNILPVQSQYRGRIFLPFMDEDPKTAEIISKIVMLSADHKIKDPTVLEQINKKG